MAEAIVSKSSSSPTSVVKPQQQRQPQKAIINKPKGRVYVTQQPRPNRKGWMPNLETATQYGAIHYIFDGGLVVHSDPTFALFQAEEALETFDPKTDYVLWPNMGNPTAVWLIAFILARKNLDFVRVLYWERRMRNGQRDSHDGFYTPVTLQLPKLT